MDGPRELVALPDAKKARGVKSSTVIWNEIKAGTFPAPVIINGRRYWFRDELEAWQQNLPRIREGLTRTPRRITTTLPAQPGMERRSKDRSGAHMTRPATATPGTLTEPRTDGTGAPEGADVHYP